MLTNTRLRSFKSRTSRGLVASASLLPAARLAQRAKAARLTRTLRPKSSPVASHSGPAGCCKSFGSPRIACARFSVFHRRRSRVCKAKWSLWSLLSAISNLSTQTNRAALVRMERRGAFPTRRFYVHGGGGAAEKYTVNWQWQLAHIHTFIYTYMWFPRLWWIQKLYSTRMFELQSSLLWKRFTDSACKENGKNKVLCILYTV